MGRRLQEKKGEEENGVIVISKKIKEENAMFLIIP